MLAGVYDEHDNNIALFYRKYDACDFLFQHAHTDHNVRIVYLDRRRCKR